MINQVGKEKGYTLIFNKFQSGLRLRRRRGGHHRRSPEGLQHDRRGAGAPKPADGVGAAKTAPAAQSLRLRRRPRRRSRSRGRRTESRRRGPLARPVDPGPGQAAASRRRRRGAERPRAVAAGLVHAGRRRGRGRRAHGGGIRRLTGVATLETAGRARPVLGRRRAARGARRARSRAGALLVVRRDGARPASPASSSRRRSSRWPSGWRRFHAAARPQRRRRRAAPSCIAPPGWGRGVVGRRRSDGRGGRARSARARSLAAGRLRRRGAPRSARTACCTPTRRSSTGAGSARAASCRRAPSSAPTGSATSGTAQAHRKIPQVGIVAARGRRRDRRQRRRSTARRSARPSSGGAPRSTTSSRSATTSIVGEHSLLCGQAGIGGSSRLGPRRDAGGPGRDLRPRHDRRRRDPDRPGRDRAAGDASTAGAVRLRDARPAAPRVPEARGACSGGSRAALERLAALEKQLRSWDRRERVEIRIDEILKILPHRYPFLLVDRILELEPGKRVVGIKNVTFNEEFFQGHFPGQPGDARACWCSRRWRRSPGSRCSGVVPDKEKKLLYLSGVDRCKFPAARRAGRPAADRGRDHLAEDAGLQVPGDGHRRRQRLRRGGAPLGPGGPAVSGRRSIPRRSSRPAPILGDGVDDRALRRHRRRASSSGRGTRVGAHAPIQGPARLRRGQSHLPARRPRLRSAGPEVPGRADAPDRSGRATSSASSRRSTGGRRTAGGETVIGDDNYFMNYTHVGARQPDRIAGRHGELGGSGGARRGRQPRDHRRLQRDPPVLPGRARTRSWAPTRAAARTCSRSAGPTASDAKTYGLNTIGLKRNGFSDERIEALQKAYRFLVKSKLNTSQALERIAEELAGPAGRRGAGALHPGERAGLHQVTGAPGAGDARLAPVRLAIVGVGHLGRHHARVAAELPGVALVGRPRSPRGAGRRGGARVRDRRVLAGPEEVADARRGGRRRDADELARGAGPVLPRARPRRPRREADRAGRGGGRRAGRAGPRPRRGSSRSATSSDTTRPSRPLLARVRSPVFIEGHRLGVLHAAQPRRGRRAGPHDPRPADRVAISCAVRSVEIRAAGMPVLTSQHRHRATPGSSSRADAWRT